MDDRITKKYQSAARLFSTAKITGILAAMGFVCGLLQGEFRAGLLTGLVFFIPAAICCFTSIKLAEEADAMEHKQNMQKLDELHNTYNSVKETAHAAYRKVSNIFQKPDHTYHIEVFSNESLQDICALQAEGDWWKTHTRPCECWIDIKSKEYNIGAFCLLETFESFDAKVARLPDFFKSDEEAFRNVWRKYIPFSDVLFYTVIGDISVTSSVSGGDATYCGVSVNGIGFGEWEVDPIQIHHKEHDRRMVALIYKDCDEECSLFFPVEMLPKLQILIPQFNQTYNFH